MFLRFANADTARIRSEQIDITLGTSNSIKIYPHADPIEAEWFGVITQAQLNEIQTSNPALFGLLNVEDKSTLESEGFFDREAAETNGKLLLFSNVDYFARLSRRNQLDEKRPLPPEFDDDLYSQTTVVVLDTSPTQKTIQFRDGSNNVLCRRLVISEDVGGGGLVTRFRVEDRWVRADAQQLMDHRGDALTF